MANSEELKKAAFAKVEAGIIVLRKEGVTETQVRRFIEAKLNEARRG